MCFNGTVLQRYKKNRKVHNLVTLFPFFSTIFPFPKHKGPPLHDKYTPPITRGERVLKPAHVHVQKKSSDAAREKVFPPGAIIGGK